MYKTKEKTGEKSTTHRRRKRMEKKVLYQPFERNGEELSSKSASLTDPQPKRVNRAEEKAQDDQAQQAQIEYAVNFDRQAELEYADEDPDRIRITSSTK